MKLWELWVRYIEYINELLNEKRWLKLSGHILIILFCTASVGTFLSGIVYLFIINWEEIATVVGTILIVIIFIIGLFPKKKAVPTLPEATPTGYDPVFLNSTYNLLRTNMVSILAETADMLHLRMISSY